MSVDTYENRMVPSRDPLLVRPNSDQPTEGFVRECKKRLGMASEERVKRHFETLRCLPEGHTYFGAWTEEQRERYLSNAPDITVVTTTGPQGTEVPIPAYDNEGKERPGYVVLARAVGMFTLK